MTEDSSRDTPDGEEVPTALLRVSSTVKDWAALAREATEADEIYKSEIERLQSERTATADHYATLMGPLEEIVEKAHRFRHRAGGSKTLSLPHGVSTLRAAPLAKTSLDVADEDRLMAWAEASGVIDVVFPRTLSTSGLNSIAKPQGSPEPGTVCPVPTKDGEIIPGVTVTKKADTWKLKLKE